MTHPCVHVQITPTSIPSTPAWLGEVAMLAHVFSQLGLQKAIEERVRFARARMGDYEVIDFVVMLLGYAVSGERTLTAFYQRLLPFTHGMRNEAVEELISPGRVNIGGKVSTMIAKPLELRIIA